MVLAGGGGGVVEVESAATGKRAQRSLLAEIPQADSVVVGAGREVDAIGREVETENLLDVALQRLQQRRGA